MAELTLSDLHLIQFRNYEELKLTCSPAINCLTGPNGAGKTNVLDALHYLAFTRGFRHSQDQQAVMRGMDFFFDGGTLKREGITRQVHCNFVKGKGKKVLINQQPIQRMSDHIGLIPMVAILPQDTDLINGPAAGRRQFMDMLISQYDRSYLRELIAYNRVLSQRNALLRHFHEHQYSDAEQLALWDDQLVRHGLAIQAGRGQFVQRFMPLFDTFFQQIVAQGEHPHLTYRPSIKEATEDAWQVALAEKLPKDQVNLYTSVGSHRDDLSFQIDERSARNFGSQGQQKTFIISLKLAQYQLLQQETGFAPILLLDDIFDKLDEHRLGRIAALLDQDIDGQIFITDTSQERLAKVFGEAERAVRFFGVRQGKAELLT